MGMVAYFKMLEPAEPKLLCTKPDEIEDVLFPPDADDPFAGQLCLDKEWHMLHYALCKRAEAGQDPLSMAILGGNEIGPDLGYGHGRLIHSGMVEQIYLALRDLNFDDSYNSIEQEDPELDKIYGEFEFDDSEREFYRELCESLQDFYRCAHERNLAVFAYLA